MTDLTVMFFQRLSRRGHEPLLTDATATVRVDITQGNRTDGWLVRIDRGDVRVSNGDAESDCVIGADRALFNGIVSGEANIMAALLRGELTVEGDPELLVLFQRLFPGPSGMRDR